MSSCSPPSVVFDSSPSLTFLKASGSLPSLDFSKLKPIGNLSSSSSPKSFDYIDFDMPKFEPISSFKSSSSPSSWGNTLSRLNKINLPKTKPLEFWKSSSSPKCLDYINFNTPKFEPFKIEPIKPLKSSSSPVSLDYLKDYFNTPKFKPINSLKSSSSLNSWGDTLNKINLPKTKPLEFWKSSSSPKSFDYLKNYFNTPKFEPIKNNLESSASSPSIFNHLNKKSKFPYLYNEDNKKDYSTQFNYLDTLGEMQKSGHDFAHQKGYYDWKGNKWGNSWGTSFKPNDNLYIKDLNKEDQLHIHVNEFNIITFAKIKETGTNKTKRNLSNYEAAIEDLKPGKSFWDKIKETLLW